LTHIAERLGSEFNASVIQTVIENREKAQPIVFIMEFQQQLFKQETKESFLRL
jgi:hypothetical protein